MRRLLIGLGLVAALMAAALVYVLFQLTILQPPVVAPNINLRRLARAYVVGPPAPRIETYRSFQAGAARVYAAGTTGRPMVLLPDSGTGAWAYENYLAALNGDRRVYAVSLRGMVGARPAGNATLDDYLRDARDAVVAARRDAGGPVVLGGQGLGALLALRLAADDPSGMTGVVLISPYAVRERTDHQTWLAQTFGALVYDRVFASEQSLRDFALENFPSGLVQRDLQQRHLPRATAKLPFEYRPVIREVTLGDLRWLPEAYDRLARSGLPVLHIAANYDVTNPQAAQYRVRELLEPGLGKTYFFSILNSGRLVSLDWRWRASAALIDDFLTDLRLDAPIVEQEVPLDPAQVQPQEGQPQ